MPINMKYTWFALPALVLTLSLMGGCGGSPEALPMETNAVKAELFGKVWKLENLFSREIDDEIEQPLTLEFKEDGTVNGFGGCNNFRGQYTLKGEEISFGPLMSTKKSCGPATDEQEYTFMTFLAQIKKLKIKDDELQLFSNQQNVPMVLTTGGGGFLW